MKPKIPRRSFIASLVLLAGFAAWQHHAAAMCSAGAMTMDCRK